MRLKLLQISGIIRYEFRMMWRGRALLVIILALVVMNGLTALMMRSNSDVIPVEVILNHSAMAWITVGVTLAFLLPVVISDTIPKDHQIGVRELLDTLPMTRGVYLLGKLLGVYAAVLFGLLITMLITGAIDFFMFGEIVFSDFLGIWLIGVVAMAVLSGGLGVLLPATQPNRRRAVVLVIVVLVLSFVFNERSFQQGTLEAYLNPIRPPILMRYLSGMGGTFASGTVTQFKQDDVWLSIGAGLVELGVIGAAVWGWLRWRETRA